VRCNSKPPISLNSSANRLDCPCPAVLAPVTQNQPGLRDISDCLPVRRTVSNVYPVHALYGHVNSNRRHSALKISVQFFSFDVS
jgi:hypothetical protein